MPLTSQSLSLYLDSVTQSQPTKVAWQRPTPTPEGGPGEASHCQRPPDQDPISPGMTAWEQRKSLEKAAMLVWATDAVTLLRSLYNTPFAISLLFESTDAPLARETKAEDNGSLPQPPNAG